MVGFIVQLDFAFGFRVNSNGAPAVMGRSAQSKRDGPRAHRKSGEVKLIYRQEQSLRMASAGGLGIGDVHDRFVPLMRRFELEIRIVWRRSFHCGDAAVPLTTSAGTAGGDGATVSLLKREPAASRLVAREGCVAG